MHGRTNAMCAFRLFKCKLCCVPFPPSSGLASTSVLKKTEKQRIGLTVLFESVLVLTYHRIPPDFRDGFFFIYFSRHTPSGQSRVYRVTQLRIDGVHCQESAGTGPVNIKVIPNGW